VPNPRQRSHPRNFVREGQACEDQVEWALGGRTPLPTPQLRRGDPLVEPSGRLPPPCRRKRVQHDIFRNGILDMVFEDDEVDLVAALGRDLAYPQERLLGAAGL